jgi:hypothetical protein
MTTVYFDEPVTDEQRRARLYGGDLFVYSPTQGALKLVEHAKAMVAEAFGGRDPELAQFEMAVEDYAAVLAKLKPAFIHHPNSKKFIIEMLQELGCDPAKVHFDLPRLRTSTSNDYLTTGIAYAFHPHRDTWYSAAPCQLNWWMPVMPITRDNGMAFHPAYFDKPVKNNSSDYDYYEWNQTSRKSAAEHIKTDTRVQPKPQEPVDLDPQIRIVSPPGGVTIFSAQQFHSSVPNTSGKTRFSIDFRTVNVDDAAAKRGAPNVDSACTGTALRDFLRLTDLERVPEAVASLYDEGASTTGVKIFEHADQ